MISLGHVEKWLHKQVKTKFKIHDFTTWEANNYNAHIANISSSRGNQTMKFGQLIEYDMKNIFLENSCIKYVEKTSPRHLPRKIENKLDQ